MKEMLNILTVDCEDWYHTEISQKYIDINECRGNSSQFCSNVDRLLELFHETNSQATFFVLGVLAEQFPELIIKIEKAGHRVGAHGYNHTNIFSMSKNQFEEEVGNVTKVLNSLLEKDVVSFRAPNWSINTKCSWAFDILKKYGYKYDSSVKNFEGIQSTIYNSGIIEIPRSQIKFCGLKVPLGGAFLKILPFSLVRNLAKKANNAGKTIMVYVHPWEINENIPRIQTSIVDGIIQYYGIKRNLPRIRWMLEKFEYVSIEKYFNEFSREGNLCR